MERNDSSEDEFSTCALSVTLQALRKVLLGFKAAKAELEAENAALKEQRASWELEKNMLLDEKEHLVSTLFIARRYIHSVKESLRFHKTETDKATKAWKEQHHQLNEMKPSFDKAVMELKKERESRGLVTENGEAASLENLQQDSERKRSRIIQEKEVAITSDRKGVMALEEEHLEETRQRETEWQTQHKVLEGQIECELASKETLKTSEQKQSREVEEKWLNKEEEWLNKEREMRDEMQRLNQRNAQLQELAAKTDKEKARMKKVEEKAEKRMKKEREEREEKERKDRLKKEEKENEDRKKREKTARKKRGYHFLNPLTPFTLSPLLRASPMPASLTEMS